MVTPRYKSDDVEEMDIPLQVIFKLDRDFWIELNSRYSDLPKCNDSYYQLTNHLPTSDHHLKPPQPETKIAESSA